MTTKYSIKSKINKNLKSSPRSCAKQKNRSNYKKKKSLDWVGSADFAELDFCVHAAVAFGTFY
jgi:hypothetical protein